MAITQNTYTGNGSTVLYSFSFPYLETTDVKVSLNGTVTTAYTFANATTIQFNTAPANGAAIRIYRETDDTALQAVLSPGSSIRASDLNDNFDQLIYLGQEANTEADSATATANTALTNSATAISTANTASTNASAAVSTANTASANASAAVSTANTASTNASTAVSTANTASTNASTALSTANAATTTANNAVTTANTASSTANTALTNANAAVSTANTASTNASNAVTTANTASANASSAVTTANNAVTTANSAVITAGSAVTTANSAVTTANAAAAAVANAVLYTTVANVAAIPVSPANNTAIEVTNSTGIESFTPLSGLPAGFVGSSGLSVRIIYQTVGSTWTWIQYFPNDPENRYFKLSGGTITGPITVPQGTVSSPGVKFSGTGNDNTGVYSPGIDELGLVTNGTARLTIDSAGAVAIPGTLGVTGAITGSLTGAASSNVLKAGDTMTGALVHPLGAAATPSITFTGDTNTGIYSSGADQVAISTNGSGRLFIDASGNVGAGTPSPDARLDVTRSGNGLISVLQTDANRGFAFESQTNSQIQLSSIQPSTNFDLWANTITFSAGGSERGRFDSSGRLGLGTSSPSNTLHVVDSSSQFVGTVRLGGGSGSSGYYATIQQDALTTGKLAINAVAAAGSVHGIQLQVDGTSALAIDASRRVGIGTQTPSWIFDVKTATGYIGFNTSGGLGSQIRFANSSNVNTAAISNNGGSNELLQFDINNNAGAGQIVFNTVGSERARIDSSGRLLVGTSTSRSNWFNTTGADPLTQLEGSGATRLGITSNGNNANCGEIALGNSRSTAYAVVADGDQIGRISFQGADGSEMVAGAYIDALVDGTPGANDMPGRLVFSTTLDGASSPTERMRLTNQGAIWAASRAGVSVFGSTTHYHGLVQNSGGQWILGLQNNGNEGDSGFGLVITYANTAPNNTGNSFIQASDSTASRFVVRSNGGIANYSGNNVNLCDEREKKNIVNLDSTWDCLKHWELKKFHYNEDADTDELRYGVIAQQVADYCPEVISEWVKQKAEPAKLDDEGNEIEPAKEEIMRMAVKEQQMMWMAIKALQEAQLRIETLEAEVAALKGA